MSAEQPKDFQDINQSIWNNKFVSREGVVFYLSLHGKGFLFIRDLLDETGSFLIWSIVKENFSHTNEDYMNWMSVSRVFQHLSERNENLSCCNFL